MPANEVREREVVVRATDQGIRVAVRYPPAGANNWETDYPAMLTPEKALLLIFRLGKAVDDYFSRRQPDT